MRDHCVWSVSFSLGVRLQFVVFFKQKTAYELRISDWSSDVCSSDLKTFHRRFVKSTGMTFGKWRQQLRLMSSLTQLMQGAPITQVALNSGYDSHSAYTTAFKKQVGQASYEFTQRQSVIT